ncbi:MAG: hypothetical protein HY000_14260 [Planctomycetes bacterium]|nr:hypothetical protein [Planctomycetota bacterium]
MTIAPGGGVFGVSQDSGFALMNFRDDGTFWVGVPSIHEVHRYNTSFGFLATRAGNFPQEGQEASGGTLFTTVAEVLQQGWAQTYPARISGGGGGGGGGGQVQLVGQWNGHDHDYADVSGEGNYAYLGHVAAGGGVDIIDISDPANPVELARITSAQGGHNQVHNVFIDGNYLYEADTRTPSVKVFNVTNPAAPTFVRSITSPTGAPVHDITVVNGRLFTSVIGGPLIGGEGGTDIFDVSNVEVAAPLLGTFASDSYDAARGTDRPGDADG